MNIGIFTDSYHPDVSGVVTSIDMLADELKKLGHNVYIFTIANPLAGKKRPGVFRLPSMPFIFYKSRRLALFYSPRASRCVKHMNLDIIHTQTEFSLGIFGTIMSRQLGIPLVHTYHTLYKDYVHYISKNKFKKVSNDIVRIYSRSYCNSCDAVITPSKKVYDLLDEYGVNKDIRIIPTGIDIYRFRREKVSTEEILRLKESYGIDKSAPVIVFIGRLDKEKSIDMILNQMPNILKTLPDTKFLIVGDGQATQELKELTSSLKIESSVIFAGIQPWNKISMFYMLGDVFVSCSITETQGLTLIEAMAAGVPIIARYDRNIEGLVQDKINGRIFNNENNLTDVIVAVLSDKEASSLYAKNAMDTVQNFSSQIFGKNVEALYKELLMQNTKKRLRKSFKKFSFKLKKMSYRQETH